MILDTINVNGPRIQHSSPWGLFSLQTTLGTLSTRTSPTQIQNTLTTLDDILSRALAILLLMDLTSNKCTAMSIIPLIHITKPTTAGDHRLSPIITARGPRRVLDLLSILQWADFTTSLEQVRPTLRMP